VYAKCVEAGFNSYVTKPVDFKELSSVFMRFLDPPESGKGKPVEFMRIKSGGGGSHRRR
jgi:DNA-binding response OmpR family regulator